MGLPLRFFSRIRSSYRGLCRKNSCFISYFSTRLDKKLPLCIIFELFEAIRHEGNFSLFCTLLYFMLAPACARSISINKRWNRTKAGIISHERQKGGTSTRRQSNLVVCTRTRSIRPGRWTIFFRISNLVVCARRNALVKITKLNGRRVHVGSRLSHGKWRPSLCDSIGYL